MITNQQHGKRFKMTYNHYLYRDLIKYLYNCNSRKTAPANYEDELQKLQGTTHVVSVGCHAKFFWAGPCLFGLSHDTLRDGLHPRVSGDFRDPWGTPSSPLRCSSSFITHYLLSYFGSAQNPKRSRKAPAVALLRINILRCTKTALLNP